MSTNAKHVGLWALIAIVVNMMVCSVVIGVFVLALPTGILFWCNLGAVLFASTTHIMVFRRKFDGVRMVIFAASVVANLFVLTTVMLSRGDGP